MIVIGSLWVLLVAVATNVAEAGGGYSTLQPTNHRVDAPNLQRGSWVTQSLWELMAKVEPNLELESRTVSRGAPEQFTELKTPRARVELQQLIDLMRNDVNRMKTTGQKGNSTWKLTAPNLKRNLVLINELPKCINVDSYLNQMRHPDMLEGATRMLQIQKWIWKFKRYRRNQEFSNLTKDHMEKWVVDRCMHRLNIHLESLDPVFELDDTLRPDWFDRYELFSEPPRKPARILLKGRRFSLQ